MTPCNAHRSTRWKLIHQAAAPCNIRRCRSIPSSVTAVLLIIAGIEPNPGPAAIKIGLLNARSTVNKGPLIQDIIINEQLDILAVTETWIVSDDADTTKLDAVPDGYAVSQSLTSSYGYSIQQRWRCLHHPPENHHRQMSSTAQSAPEASLAVVRMQPAVSQDHERLYSRC